MNATVEQLAPVEQQATNNWVVAALYQFKEVADAADLQKRLLDLVNSINLCGTLIVAPEGINGTVAGDRAAIDAVHQFYSTKVLPKWNIRSHSALINHSVK